MHVNKVHHVTTINRVAEQLGADEDCLRDVASEMEIEDGVIWVYGVGEDGVLAFTDFGIESLIELINTYKENPALLVSVVLRPRLEGLVFGRPTAAIDRCRCWDDR